MRLALVIVTLALVAPAGAQDEARPLGPLGDALAEAKEPGFDATPRDGAMVVVGHDATGHATLTHARDGDAPLHVRLKVSLEAPTEAEDGPPRGAGLVFMTGPNAFVAFVLLPGGRTGVYAYHPQRGLQARMTSGWDFDSSQPHELTLRQDGRTLTFGLDGDEAGKFGNASIAGARGPVGLIVLGDATCVVHGYAIGEPDAAAPREE